ncbi:MAG TPA: hypothetical protein VGI48_10290 [Caldimonas sp.]
MPAKSAIPTEAKPTSITPASQGLLKPANTIAATAALVAAMTRPRGVANWPSESA